jgi:hypothetical protein
MIALWNKLKGWAALAGVALFAIGVAFIKGRAAGIAHIEAEQERRRLDAIKARKETDDEVDQLGSNDVDDRLARWLRDDDR